MLLAFLCYRLKLVNQEGNKCCSNLLLLVVNPCLIITAYQMDYDEKLVHGLFISFVCAFIAHIIAIVLAHFLIPEKNNPYYSIDRYAVVYSNCGFIGIPLVSSVLGSEGVFYLTAYMTMFNLFTWTHGLSLIQGKFSLRQMKEGLLSPMIIAIVFAITLFFLRIRLPSVLLDSMEYVANMNTPLAMMIAGFSVAQADLKQTVKNFKVYWTCFLKLFVVPLAVLLFLFLTKTDYTAAYTTLIAAACPAGTTVTMMAIRYGKNYTHASEIFSFSTILSIVTIPVVMFIAGFLL